MAGTSRHSPYGRPSPNRSPTRIAGPRARGRVAAAGPVRPSSLPPPNPNPFGSIDPNAVNSGANQRNSLPSFSFGQPTNHQPNGNIFGQTQSQSFPQTTSGSVMSTQNGPNSFGGFGSGNNSSFNFNLPTNSSGFQFPQTEQNSNSTNVFGSNGTKLGGSSQPASTGFSGFQGSLFNIPGGSAPTEQNNASTSAPSSIFGQPTANHSPDNPFVSLNPSSTTSNSLFGNSSSTRPAAQPSPNPFRNQPTLNPTTDLFGSKRSIDESYSPQPPAMNTESSNANPSTSTDRSSRAIAHPRNFVPPPPDRMQTSPDGTPAKTTSPAKPNPWASLATSSNSTATPTVGATSTNNTSTSNKMFGAQGAAAAQPPFGPTSTSTPTPSTNPLFGARVTKLAESSTTQAGPSNPLFGARVTKPESTATPATSSGFNFGAQGNTSVFSNKAQSTSTTSAAPSLFATSASTPTTTTMFGSVGTTQSAPPGISSSSSASIIAPSTPAPPNSILKRKKPSLSKVAEGKKPARDDSPQPFNFAAPLSAPSGNMFSVKPSQTAASSSLVPTSTQVSAQVFTQETVPAHWDTKMTAMYTEGRKLRSLNHGFQKWIGIADPNSVDFDNVIRFYLHKRLEMGLPVELDTSPTPPPVAGSKRKPSDDPSFEGGPGNNKRSRSDQASPQNSTPTPQPSSSSTRTFGAATSTFSFLNEPKANAAATGSGGLPAKSDAAPTSSNVAPTSNIASTGSNFAFGTSNGPPVFGQTAPTNSNGVSSSRPTMPMPTPGAPRVSFQPSQAAEVSSSPLKTKKRPAREEDQDADEQSRKRNKNDEHNEDQSASGSHTSSMFKDMLNKPTSDNDASNDASSALSQQPAVSSTETPGLNALINPAHGSRPSVSASTSSTANHATPTSSSRNFFGPPRVNGITISNPFGSQPASSQTGSSAPSLFGSASQNLNGSSAPSMNTHLFGNASQNSNGNALSVFGSQPAQSSLSVPPSDGIASTTSAPTNTTATPNANSNASSSTAANATLVATSNPGFNFITGQPMSGGSGIKLPTFAPPSFGGGVGLTNFADQFAASAEKATMMEAMEADYDSEEHGTKEQWMEMYKKKQKAKAEEMEKARKAVDFKFVEGEGFSFSEREDGPDDAASESDAHSAQAAPSNPFQPKPSPLSQDTIPPLPKNQHLSAVFNSGASTPSTTGGASVFDEPRSTGLQVPNATNPFGHLSDVDSGVDSKTGDADDEDDSGEDESGSENSPKNRGDSGSDGGSYGGSSHDSSFADGPNRYDERTLRRFDGDDVDDDGDDDDNDGNETRDYPEDEDDGGINHGDQDSSGYGEGEPDTNGEGDSFMNNSRFDDSIEHDSMFVDQEDSINNDSMFNEQDSPMGEAALTDRPHLGFGEISFLDTPAWERLMQAKHVKECEREARAFNEAYSGRAERIESLNIIPRVGLPTSSSTSSRSESSEPLGPSVLPLVQPSKPPPPVVQPGRPTSLQAHSAITNTAVRESRIDRYAKKAALAANALGLLTVNDRQLDSTMSDANSTDRPEPGRGIFARLQYDDNGNPMKAPAKESKTEEEGKKQKKPLYPTFDFLNPPGKRKSDDDSDGQPGSVKAQKKDESSSPGPNSVFGQSSSQNPFGQSRFQPSSSAFTSQPSGDNTWTPQTPIRFGGAPVVSVTSPSPTPAETTPLPTFNLGSSASAVGVPGSLFGQSTGTSTSTPPPSLGFGFGGPRTQASMLAAESAADSRRSSRASSPGMTTDTGGETDADSEVVEQHAQANFMSRDGEEDEDLLFEVKAKAMLFGQNQTRNGDQITLSPAAWQNRGIGPLRLLKNKTTGKCRVLQRQEPSGRIIINSGLIPSYSYDYQVPKGVKLVLPKEDNFETWVLKVGSEQKAEQLSQLLQQHKSD